MTQAELREDRSPNKEVHLTMASKQCIALTNSEDQATELPQCSDVAGSMCDKTLEPSTNNRKRKLSGTTPLQPLPLFCKAAKPMASEYLARDT